MGTQPRVVKVALLTQPQCAFCEQAKEVLERLSAEYPLFVRVLELGSTEGRIVAEQSGIFFPPGILLDGDSFSYGRVSERKLRQEIERRLSLTS